MPFFANPNVSIITGAPPSVHQVAGNLFLGRETDASNCSMDENGISDVEAWIGRSAPPQYSAELSLFVFDAGTKLLQKRAGLFYLTLSDYIQDKHAPGTKEAAM
ncbi:phosphonoacetate hydrolase [Paracoccidioides lutzii Pb01]|uniref:Phosphonoacetate hydrolase n=1 Tax=Paracoccidioides lutzii (strain ATCC MYA-826 / Pb01) TaxID=502779 RepID=C1GVW7_PARBA|nr:phosphonoacetate hydrolase [Paracoccidioides lutzii Pb01]EEH40686.2 phosphonoacetate hydrolase [Paracoccidioides lutzii Pb01]